LSNDEAVFVPSNLTADMMTTPIRPARRPYSIAVAPDSWMKICTAVSFLMIAPADSYAENLKRFATRA
jgi:hypothetical protein